MLKQLAIFLFGASTGGFITVSVLEKYYEKRTDEEIEKAKEFYEEKFKKAVDDIYYSWEAQQELDKETVENINEDYDSGFRDEYLDKIIDGVEDDEEQTVIDIFPDDEEITDTVEIDGEEYDITYEEEEHTSDIPYVITEEEFSSEKLHYDKMSAVYYSDGTLVNEDEEMMEIPDTVGYEALDELVNNDVVYIRNESLGIDFMVTSTNNSYADYILGVDYEEETPNKRRKEEDER